MKLSKAKTVGGLLGVIGVLGVIIIIFDAVLREYLDRYTLKSAGIGFVAPPYSSLYDRVWGVTPVDDLPKLQTLYEFNPYIAASVDVRVNLTVSNWLELKGGK